MLVTVQIEELTELKKELAKAKIDLEEIKKATATFDAQTVHQKVGEMAEKLMISYLEAIFEKLGFDNSSIGDYEFMDLHEFISRNWYEPQNRTKVTIKIGANLSDEFKRAFIRFGYNPWAMEPIQGALTEKI